MKFTLKNRPHSTRGTRQYYNPEVDAWFEGFENELRTELTVYDKPRIRNYHQELIQKIKEILAE